MATNRCGIELAQAADAAAIEALLQDADLSTSGMEARLAHFLVARDETGAVIGTVGAELYGNHALLRSLVVAAPHRRVGIGARLVDALEMVAQKWGVRRWWLLTTTADEFFRARGFSRVERCSAPDAIRATTQFSGGCGEAATCWTRERVNGR